MNDIPPDAPVYPIGVVRKLTGLSDRQIRYYEQVGLFSPARSPGRRRLFAPADVETLLLIKQEMARGLRTAEIREKLGRDRPQRDPIVPTSSRRRLPRFAGGEATGDKNLPDVEARRALMARRGPKQRS